MGETELERRLNLEIEYMNETRLFPPGRDIPAACGDGDEHAHRAGAFKFWRENRRLREALEKIIEANKMFQFAPRIQTTMWNIAREALNPDA